MNDQDKAKAKKLSAALKKHAATLDAAVSGDAKAIDWKTLLAALLALLTSFLK